MTRSTRLRRLLVPTLASSLALAVAGGLTGTAPAGAVTGPVSGPVSGPVTGSAAHAPALHAGDSVVSSRMPASSDVTPRRASSPWPVGFRTATLTTHTTTASGAASQQIVSAQVEQARAVKKYVFKIVLGGAPTSTTDSVLRVAFGKIASDGSCVSPKGANVAFSAFKQGEGSATVGGYFQNGTAKTGVYDCAFVQSYSTDGATKYDAVAGRLTDHIQKPAFGIAARSALLRPHRFVDFKVTIKNSKKTVAKATKTKLTWKTRDGAVVRGSHRVGTIKPGQKKVVHLRIMIRRAHHGKVKLTASSHNYHRSLNVKVKSVRR